MAKPLLNKQMAKLEMKDMQGLIARGYDELPAACFLLVKISEPASAKKYIQFLLAENLLTPADKQEIKESCKIVYESAGNNIVQPKMAMQIAFTSAGLRKLNVPEEVMATFSREFNEGMSYCYYLDEMKIEERSLLLGDVKDNHPDNWKWGNEKNPVHAVLMYYAKSTVELNNFVTQYFTRVTDSGLELVIRQDTYEYSGVNRKHSKEHFGFRDGISQPIMDGLSKAKTADKESIIQAGEFVLGYENEYGSYTPSPIVDASTDPENILPLHFAQSDKKDLGKNGTYLVYRQLNQFVLRFWKYLYDNSKEKAQTREDAAIKLGAKLVGRWPGGAPLVLSPESDDPEKSLQRDFGYYETDSEGYKCPFGAHIRRTNPRDQLHSGRDHLQSKQMVRKHQIIRRGRSFGEPYVDSMDPNEILQKLIEAGPEITAEEIKKLDDGRGLHFICLLSDIQRQFEFIQNVWANTSTFGDLCDEVDPLISPRPTDQQPDCHEFTCPDIPLRRKYNNIPEFTRTVGGAYFFMPGLKALEFIASKF
jgi:Dyp-type peroxidase family